MVHTLTRIAITFQSTSPNASVSVITPIQTITVTPIKAATVLSTALLITTTIVMAKIATVSHAIRSMPKLLFQVVRSAPRTKSTSLAMRSILRCGSCVTPRINADGTRRACCGRERVMWRWLTQRRSVTGQSHAEALPSGQARYRIERRIGQGAASQVFLAQDRQTGGWVALKLLELGSSPALPEWHDALERFRREATVLHGLHHPGIVKVLDAGPSERGAWMALEMVRGCDLSRYTRPSRLLPPPLVARTGARVAEALAYAHRQGVVHRDVKPANVLVDWASDTVKLSDFGLARMGEHTQTRSGVTLGSPDYMAPEQLAGGVVGPAADVYGLGASLFELLAGRRPYERDSLGALLRAVTTEPAPDLEVLRPDLDPTLAGVVMQSLAKNPTARPANADELGARLLVCARNREPRETSTP